MPPSGKNIVKALEKAGFEIIRVTGSHHILQHGDGRIATVPVHSNRDTQRGLYRKILKDVELTDMELRDLM
jgi:predicted RNA binding protein YcfA (HicA-like mRNA interferase family)